ncbi:hypothetical protein [Flavobacterium subsaxonicum]|uniref:Pentapeptide repeat-containing protein n=1 Tax=Flavobacterium subsaxonicum WB 4.1-42 = DSM 21790 TaxID=1121898 RepID=A0A0A2MU34_9FLAO|nr:hypothetical protein [Flavobacterium subsaxonicum]KGO91720.1 hypothetical protein Q766_15860 [Flavobacterium subsaxonicum WB 4.1-42 = DSM 21790]
METITGEEFEKLLYMENTISNYIIKLEADYILDISSLQKLQISSCKFNSKLVIKDSSTFNSELKPDVFNNKIIDITNCEFLSLRLEHYDDDLFINDVQIENFEVTNCKLYDLVCTSNNIQSEFKLTSCKITKRAILSGNVFKESSDLIISDSEFNGELNLNESHLCNISLFDNKFELFNFSENTVEAFGYFNIGNCKFSKSYFTLSDFTKFTIFHDCIFEQTFILEKNGNLIHTNLQLLNCRFEKSAYFTQSAINKIIIENCFFKDIASFQNSYFLEISIDKTIFDKLALFDDMQIGKVDNCDRKTLRNIKQQLQKADNKIDYNRFRNYELSAYYQELGWGWKSGFKDKFILGATLLSTGFDHSWRRALAFTLLIGFSLYALFFVSENYMLQRDFSQWQEFLSGYFRFLIVTDFYNPLAEGRTYIDNTNTIGWLIFIFGKIVIAFGIYEMIQAFRKFKA